MKSREEIKKWLLANCINEWGDLDLSNLDFTDFEGDVDISNMSVTGSLSQAHQKVGGWLNQSFQEVDEDLYQYVQKVNGNMFDYCNEVKGNFITQALKDDEEYKIINGFTYIVKKLKPITKEELEKMGYILTIE